MYEACAVQKKGLIALKFEQNQRLWTVITGVFIDLWYNNCSVTLK